VRRGRASAVAHGVTWVAWGVLIAQQIADAWLHQAPWIVWLAYCLPLLIFLPGMLRDRLRSYIWLCFICLLYFMRLVVKLFAEPGSALAIVGTVAVVTLFIAAMMYVRWRAREVRAAGAIPTVAGE
jgi:uncharacterized membrane protein